MTTPNIEELRLLAQTLEFSDAVRCSIQRAADLLQSQAERIAELEEAAEESSADAVIIQYHEAAIKRLKIEDDSLRAQLERQGEELAKWKVAAHVTKLHLEIVSDELATAKADLARVRRMTTPNIEELIDRLYDWHNTSAEQNRLDMQKAADLLQSQAESIKVIEREGEMRRIALHDVMLESDQLRAELADAELHTKQVERGLDKATAQLAEIEKTEPVAWRWVWKSKPHDIEGWCYTHTPPNHPELQEIEKLFTRPHACAGCDGVGGGVGNGREAKQLPRIQ